MELNGEDKRIRELFCELKREEERTSLLFAKTWNSAEAEFQRTGFGRLRFQSLANLMRFATPILIVSLVVTATFLLPKYLRRQPKRDNAKQAATVGPSVNSEESPRFAKVLSNRESGRPMNRRLAIRKSVRVKNALVASARGARPDKQDRLSQWQSPTATLLRSVSDELLGFLPPMNESAEGMKKFLANDLN